MAGGSEHDTCIYHRREGRHLSLCLTTMQTVCTLDRLIRGLSRPFDPTGKEVPFVAGISTRPITATLASHIPKVGGGGGGRGRGRGAVS